MLVRSRRRFMGACAAGLAALGLTPVRVSAADPIGSRAFAAMVGDYFYLASYSNREQGKVKLFSVEEIGVARELDQFHLRFKRSRRGARLSEGLFAVTNWGGHPYFDIHLQPFGVDRNNREMYIASFAQIRQGLPGSM
ncbi:MAG: twin-arginine translocation signal domain-containing protein [Gammaproteobacteria bacterium]|nr:twin-arginine translocation signal domain-containing protein [Gammaproteobacteria bacterium]